MIDDLVDANHENLEFAHLCLPAWARDAHIHLLFLFWIVLSDYACMKMRAQFFSDLFGGGINLTLSRDSMAVSTLIDSKL